MSKGQKIEDEFTNMAKHDFTQAQLADKVSARRETIVFLEKGKYNPSLQLAHDVAQAFDLSIEEVFLFDS